MWKENNRFVTADKFCRVLSCMECERLQTLPDGYTEGLVADKRKELIGNGWTVDVIAHILKGLK
jgi:DNA (cytosine-5)-methyltransferase 3A